MTRIAGSLGGGRPPRLFPRGEGKRWTIFAEQARVIQAFLGRITNKPGINVSFIENPRILTGVDPQVVYDPNMLGERLKRVTEQTPVALQPGGRLAEGLSITKAGDLNSLLDRLRHHYHSLAGEQSLQCSLNRPSVDVYASADTGVTARLIKPHGRLTVRLEIIADRDMSYFAIVDIKVPN